MQRRTPFVASVALVVLLVVAAGALAGASATGGPTPQHDYTEAPSSQTQSDYYVVAFKDPPAASYTGGIRGLKPTKRARGEKLNARAQEVLAYVDHLRGVHASYRGWLSSKAPSAEVVRELFLVGNAVAVKANGARPETLQQGPGVRYVTASWLYRPTMTISNELIGADEVWDLAAAGGRESAGSGIKVGVIDTGIRDDHPAFACKDEIPHDVFASGVAFDPSNTIVFNHGTHVAGTVAGCVLDLDGPEDGPTSGIWSGVAPGADLHDYNVFPGFGAGFIAFGGSAFSHDICAALEKSVADEMDVVNMSIGGGVQGPHDLLAECTDATADAGIVPAVAAGNSGPGDGTVESPGSAPGALTAGASTNPHFVGIPVTVGSTTFGAALGDFENFDPAITADYTVTEPADGCTEISTDLTDQIALIDRGVCTFSTKIRNAESAGADGVLIVNNVAGDPVGMAHDGLAFPTIPAAMLGKDDGASIKPSGTATVDGTDPEEFITDNEDIIAGFSSRGPTPFTHLIKPDLTAPGVNVYSSVFDEADPDELGFAYFQGTSMATPHLAGSAALLLALHENWSPADVKSALVTTAKRPVFSFLDGTSNAGTENLATGEHDVVGREALARGGGRANLPDADVVPVTLDPASTSFGLWEGNKVVSATRSVSVLNVTGSEQTCSVTVDGPSIFSVTPGSIELDAGESTTLTVSLNAGNATDTGSGDYSGDIVVDCGSTLLSPVWTRIDRQGKP